MEEYGVTKYRAVATSASREARNSGTLVRRVKQATGLRLEVITAKENRASAGKPLPPLSALNLRPTASSILAGAASKSIFFATIPFCKAPSFPLATVR